MANYLNQQLQDFARAAGAVYQGDGMGLHHFKELSTNSNFSLRIPPAESRECITIAKILTRAQEVRKSYGKPEPELPTWETTGTASVGAGSTRPCLLVTQLTEIAASTGDGSAQVR